MRAAAVALVMALVAVAVACGESRSPIGDECLRSEDCLSGVCSARSCVAAAPVVMIGVGAPPPDETARIPVVDAGPSDASGGG